MNKFIKIIQNYIFSRHIIPVVFILVMLSPAFSYQAVLAQDTPPVKLEFGGTGLQSWNISNLVPGNSGTKTLILKNTGYKDGAVTVWISNLVSTNGIDPVTERLDTSKPGDLQNYLELNLTGTGLATNLVTPVLLRNFPNAPDASSYFRISRLYAGESVTLTWEWKLPAETGNDVQGDSVNFSINYLLDELPPETSAIIGTAVLQGSSRLPARYNIPLIFRCYSPDTEITIDNLFDAEPMFVCSTANGTMSIDSFDTEAQTITFKIPAIILGEYNVTLYGQYCLINLKNNVTVSRGDINLYMGTLLAGNAIEDKQIFGADNNAILNDYLQEPADPKWNNGRSDFDGNNQVTSVDYSMLAMNYTRTAPQLLTD